MLFKAPGADEDTLIPFDICLPLFRVITSESLPDTQTVGPCEEFFAKYGCEVPALSGAVCRPLSL